MQNIRLLHTDPQLADTAKLLQRLHQVTITPAWFAAKVNNDLARHYFIQPVIMLPLKEDCGDSAGNTAALVAYFTKLLNTGPLEKRTAVVLPLA